MKRRTLLKFIPFMAASTNVLAKFYTPEIESNVDRFKNPLEKFPIERKLGDVHYDTINEKLYIYDGSKFVLFPNAS